MRNDVAERIVGKVKDDYDVIAAEFAAARTRVWPEMERFRSFVRAGDRVLDVGCGSGRAFALFDGLGVEYDGVDISEAQIAMARRRVSDVLATFRVGSMTALPYEDGAFDAVVAVAVLHHVPSARLRLAAVREAWRVLRPGGWLLMTNWNRWRPRYLRWHLAALVGRIAGSGHDPGDLLLPWRDGPSKVMRYYHAFTPGELARLCRSGGLDAVEQYYVDASGDRCSWLRGENLVTICRKP